MSIDSMTIALAVACCALSTSIPQNPQEPAQAASRPASAAPHWPRPRFQRGGGDAFVWFVVFGRFPEKGMPSGSKYRLTGMPRGVALTRQTKGGTIDALVGADPLAKLLDESAPGTLAKALAAPERIELRGPVADPADLDYLRNVIGMITYLMDEGGVAAIEPQTLRCWSRETWRATYFEKDEARPLAHVVILESEEPAAKGSDAKTSWLHTRGLRVFGRPDLSLHDVPLASRLGAKALLERFAVLEAQGGIVPEGQPIEMRGVPEGMAAHHAGSLEDPEFGNVHIELRWPK